jgi:aminopeptidase N
LANADCRALWCAWLLALPLAAAAQQAPFEFDRAPGRLPKQIVPQSYRIAITPHPERLAFSGTETVRLQFRAAAATIQFNSLNETLREVRLDGQPVRGVVSDNQRQLTTVTLAASAPVGMHQLTFSYEGKIEAEPQGLYMQRYSKSGDPHAFLLTTEMEPTDARRMFPCWDEPAFRATFQLTVTVPASWATLSNMPAVSRVVHGALATTMFGRTPRMPSYLVEFSGGDLRSIQSRQDGVRLGIWAVSGRQRDGAYALGNARLILSDYNRYFDYRYPLPKLDSIAIPGGLNGAMENWGAITYTQDDLLLPQGATFAQRQNIFSTQAHEMAHQWNGDLVTMGWWDDLWLNESFASWMAAKETALRNPSWQWWELVDDDRERAMSADAQASSHPIEQPVTDEQQASSAFDPLIVYSKGQAVLRMLEAYLKPDVFRDGIRRYLKARAYSNATAADLWRALSAASGRDVAQLAAPWTSQPGFPLVMVSTRCAADGSRTLTLSQQRFLLRGIEAHATHWSIPLSVRIGAAAGSSPSAVLLTQQGQSLSAGRCDQALSLDADAIGFYRVSYDAATLALDTQQFGHLPDGDRIALLDDQWALVRANSAPLPSYLALASAMGEDANTRAWLQISEALSSIVASLRGAGARAAFSAYARSLVQPLASHLGWNARAGESPDVQRLRRRLLRSLGEWGDVSTLATARQRFAALLHNPRSVQADDLGLVLSLVALDADPATFERLHALARRQREPPMQQAAYVALMQVRDPKLAEQAAQIAVSNEIPAESQQLRFELLTVLAREHPQVAWRAFSVRASSLLAPWGTFEPFMLARQVPPMFSDALPLGELETWIRSQLPAEMAPEVARGMESAQLEQSEHGALRAEAEHFIQARAHS